jgi:hypothetical protein
MSQTKTESCVIGWTAKPEATPSFRLNSTSTRTSSNLREKIMSEPRLNLEEREPNNTLEQANYAGELHPDRDIHVFGHVDSDSDPDDYLIFEATQPGDISVKTYEGDDLVSDKTVTAQYEYEPFDVHTYTTKENYEAYYDLYISYDL